MPARASATANDEQAIVDAWRSAGSQAPETPQVTLSSKFNAAITEFAATGSVLFNYYSNDNSAVLKAWLIDGNNEAVNTAEDETGGANLAPLGLPQSWRPLAATVSTLYRNCGLVGKAQIKGHTALKELTPIGVVEVYRTPINKSAPDVPLNACPEQIECNGYIVEDPSTCEDYANTNGEESGGGGTGGGGSTGSCELWRFTLQRSWDGGITWEPVRVWYEYVGC